MITLLDGRIEGVHIDVNDLSRLIRPDHARVLGLNDLDPVLLAIR
ncbi:hypothetical protein [Tautonia plasticadhaerens]|nr:hypothetical protein [Tautonia plasticadhaerens]